MDEKKLMLSLDKKFAERKQEIAKVLEKNVQLIIEGYLGGRSSTMTDSFKYEVTEEGIEISSDDKRVVFFEKGTRPHIIEAKPGKSLAFRAGETVTRKNGAKINYGDLVFTQKVNHPGTEPKPIMQPAVFLTKKKIDQLF